MLPDELEAEILARLPVKSLYRFKCVCKRWHSFIQSSSFINRYNHLSNTRHSGKILCFRKDPVTQNHVISLYDHQMTQKLEDLDCPPFFDDGLDKEKKFNVEGFEFHRIINVLGPVNGIYCIFHRLVEKFAGTLVLWNPATREHKHILPLISFPFSLSWLPLSSCWSYNPGPNMKDPLALLIGFGFDHNIDNYKVVVIFFWSEVFGYEHEWVVRVYDCATESWRTICSVGHFDEFPPFAPYEQPPVPEMHTEPEFCHCLVNGVYHWPCAGASDVVAFDMVEESFKYIQGPPIPVGWHEGKSLCLLRETLAMVASSAREEVEVWIMKEYGVEDSWDMLYSVQLGPLVGLGVLGMPDHERIYLVDKDSQLFSYGFDNHELKEHGIYGVHVYGLNKSVILGKSLGVLNYVESLAPLKPMCHPELHYGELGPLSVD